MGKTLRKKAIVVLVGLPASGKSTFVEHYHDNLFGTVRSPEGDVPAAAFADTVSSDQTLELIRGCRGITYNEAFEKYMKVADATFWSDLRTNVAAGYSVFFVDRTNMSSKSRQRIMNAIQEVPGHEEYITICVPFMVPDDILQERLASRPGKTIPAHVMKSMAESFQDPRSVECLKSEAFDIVEDFVTPANFSEKAKYLADLICGIVTTGK